MIDVRQKRVVLAGLSVWLALATIPNTAAAGSAAIQREASLHALGRTLGWLQQHAPDRDRAQLGNRVLDAWAWHLFATLHPDADVRQHAGTETDRRLQSIDQPADYTVVSLSYWATTLRLRTLRGIDIAADLRSLSAVDVEGIVRTATPTTRWWTIELLRRAGLAVRPAFSETLIAQAARTSATDFVPTKREAYQIFHELVPATDFGREPPTQLDPDQQHFVRRVLPGLIDVSRTQGDTDAVAEALVSAAIMGERASTAYRAGLRWLLERQHANGTYASARDRAFTTTPDHYRHVVLVGSFAVLTSIGAAPAP